MNSRVLIEHNTHYGFIWLIYNIIYCIPYYIYLRLRWRLEAFAFRCPSGSASVLLSLGIIKSVTDRQT